MRRNSECCLVGNRLVKSCVSENRLFRVYLGGNRLLWGCSGRLGYRRLVKSGSWSQNRWRRLSVRAVDCVGEYFRGCGLVGRNWERGDIGNGLRGWIWCASRLSKWKALFVKTNMSGNIKTVSCGIKTPVTMMGWTISKKDTW